MSRTPMLARRSTIVAGVALACVLLMGAEGCPPPEEGKKDDKKSSASAAPKTEEPLSADELKAKAYLLEHPQSNLGEWQVGVVLEASTRGNTQTVYSDNCGSYDDVCLENQIMLPSGKIIELNGGNNQHAAVARKIQAGDHIAFLDPDNNKTIGPKEIKILAADVITVTSDRKD